MTPFFKLALLQEHVTPKGLPGPARPPNPNAIKPISIGPTQALPGAQEEQGIAPEEHQKVQEQAEQAQQQAKQQVEQAKQEAALATQQQKLQLQQMKHQEAMQSGGQATIQGFVGQRFQGLSKRIQNLNKSSLKHRVTYNLFPKLAADTPQRMTRSGKSWPTFQSFSGWNGTPADSTYKAKPPVTGVPGYTPELMANIQAAPNSTWDAYKDPTATMDNMQERAGLEGSSLFGSTPNAPFKTNPNQGALTLGNLGATVGNLGSNLPRYVTNFATDAGARVLGAASHSGQALAAPVVAAGGAWDQAKADVAKGGWGALDLNPFNYQSLRDLPGNFASQLGAGLRDTAMTGLNITAPGTMLAFSSDPVQQGIESAMGHLMPGDDTAQPATPEAAPTQEGTLSNGLQIGDAIGWLKELWTKIGPYLQHQQADQQAAAPGVLPTQVGAYGHQVRNPDAAFT